MNVENSQDPVGGLLNAGKVLARVAGRGQPSPGHLPARVVLPPSLGPLQQRLGQLPHSVARRQRLERLIRAAIQPRTPTHPHSLLDLYRRSQGPHPDDIWLQEFAAGPGGGTPDGKV